MDKQTLLGLIFLAPVFGLFAFFMATLYFRSRHNKAHPESEKTPEQRLRGKIIGATMVGVIVAVDAFFYLRWRNFAPSWTITFWAAWGAFLVGHICGRWDAARRAAGKPGIDVGGIF